MPICESNVVVGIADAKGISLRLAFAVALLIIAVGDSLVAQPDREFKLGVTAGDFQAEFEKKKGDGFRLIDIATTVENNRFVTAWIWEKRIAPEWKSRSGMTQEEIQQEVTASDKAGFCLTHLTSYATGSTERYSAIWEKSNGPAMSIKYGIPHEKLNQVSRELAGDGYRPVRITAATIDEKALLTGLWEKSDDPPRDLQAGFTAARMKKELLSRQRRGFRLVQICCYVTGEQMRFAGIWEKSTGPAQQFDLAVSKEAIARLRRRREQKKFSAVQVSSCSLRSRALYAVIWEKRGDSP